MSNDIIFLLPGAMIFTLCSNTRKIEKLNVRNNQIEPEIEGIITSGKIANFRRLILYLLLNKMGTLIQDAFRMGCTDMELSNCHKNKLPAHKVELEKFITRIFEGTQIQRKTIMGYHPKKNKDCEYCQGEKFRWIEVNGCISKINKFKGPSFHLPSEEERKYVAKTTLNSFPYASSEFMQQVGWFFLNSNSSSQMVEKKIPNKFGRYNMSGDVWEWTQSTPHQFPGSDYEFRAEDQIKYVIKVGTLRSLARGRIVNKRVAIPSELSRLYIGGLPAM